MLPLTQSKCWVVVYETESTENDRPAGLVSIVIETVGPCTSNEPLSIRPFTTRSNPGPRWSKKGGGVKFGSPASIAGLPGKRAWVNVVPPLSCKGPSKGSVLI